MPDEYFQTTSLSIITTGGGPHMRVFTNVPKSGETESRIINVINLITFGGNAILVPGILSA